MGGKKKSKGESKDANLTQIPEKLYFRIGEVAKIVGVEPYVLRFWEREFSTLKPVKTKTNQRLYRRQDIELVFEIKKLLYEKKFTIEGAKRHITEGVKKKAEPRQLALNLEESELKEMLKWVRGELEKVKSLLKNIEA